MPRANKSDPGHPAFSRLLSCPSFAPSRRMGATPSALIFLEYHRRSRAKNHVLFRLFRGSQVQILPLRPSNPNGLASVWQHVARFILVALYTGTRAGAVCGAAFERVAGAGYVDLDRGIFYRRPAGARETKKRQPPGSIAAPALGASATLATAWTTVLRRV